MTRKRLFVALSTILAGCALVGASSAAAATPASLALFNRTTYSYASAFGTAQEAGQYQVMVMQSSDAAAAAQLHAANPGLKILMYQNVLFSLTTDPGGATTCTDYQGDNASHPSWFMTDSRGNRILDHAYANEYVMDVGNPGYQQACVAHAVALAKQSGFDGVYFDGLAATLAYTLPSGVTVPEYPSNTAWQAAVTALVSYAGPTAKAQGVPIVGNIGGSTLTPGLWQKWTAPLAGSEEESWTDGGAGPAQQVKDWPTKLANAAWSEANGKLTVLHSWNGTRAGNTYGLASMMLVANGHSSYSTSNLNYNSYEAWYPEYTTAQQLGAATGPYRQVCSGIYERPFANGIVLVNPTTGSTSVSLGGVYSGSQLTNVSSASMGPTSGLILLKVGPGTGAGPAPGGCSAVTSGGQPSPTGTRIACSYVPTLFSDACTASVSGGPTPPNGTVVFTSNSGGRFPAGRSCTLAVRGGNATRCAVLFAPPSHTIGTSKTLRSTAAYTGDPGHKPSRGTTTFNLRGAISGQQSAVRQACAATPRILGSAGARVHGIPIPIDVVVPGRLSVTAATGLGPVAPSSGHQVTSSCLTFVTMALAPSRSGHRPAPPRCTTRSIGGRRRRVCPPSHTVGHMQAVFTSRGGQYVFHLRLGAAAQSSLKALIQRDLAYVKHQRALDRVFLAAHHRPRAHSGQMPTITFAVRITYVASR